MNLTENLHFQLNSFSPFRSIGKKRSSSQPNNGFDLISRSFDESILRRLNSISDPPSTITLSWLSQAVGFLLFTQIEARNLISKLSSSSSSSSEQQDCLGLYLDGSVKLLDICNSISSEIERLRHRRLLITFVLRLLDASQIPAPESLRRARASLSDFEGNDHSGSGKRRGFQARTGPETLIRDLAAGLASPPRGKISSAGKLARRTIYAVGLVTVFVAGAVTSALYGLPEIARVRAPAEFAWADSFNGIESAIYSEMKRRGIDEEGGARVSMLGETDDVARRVRGVRDAIDDVVVRKERLESAVKDLETVTEKFTDGLDGLSNGVNSLFDAVLCTRTSMLDNFRVTHHGKQV